MTVTNDGDADYTAGAPATIADDLSGVLDDATFESLSESSGQAVRNGDDLTWSGAIAAGDSVSITYAVKVTNLGDHSLVNTATVPDCDDAVCDQPPTLTTGLPHVTVTKTSDPDSGSDVAAGDEITYTLTWTNDGKAAGVVDSTDDLTDVLDDARITDGPTSSDAAVMVGVSNDKFRVKGPIAADGEVTVSYTVTVRADGELAATTRSPTSSHPTPLRSPATATTAPRLIHPRPSTAWESCRTPRPSIPTMAAPSWRARRSPTR